MKAKRRFVSIVYWIIMPFWTYNLHWLMYLRLQIDDWCVCRCSMTRIELASTWGTILVGHWHGGITTNGQLFAFFLYTAPTSLPLYSIDYFPTESSIRERCQYPQQLLCSAMYDLHTLLSSHIWKMLSTLVTLFILIKWLYWRTCVISSNILFQRYPFCVVLHNVLFFNCDLPLIPSGF